MIKKLFLLLAFIAFIGVMTTAAAQKTSGSNVSYLTLSNGVKMPQFGLGTFRIPNNATCKDAVLTALRLRYRHIDTAHAYMDEAGVGEAINQFIKESGVKRGGKMEMNLPDESTGSSDDWQKKIDDELDTRK